MTGCVTMKNGKFYGIYYTGQKINGKYKQKWTRGFSSRAECEKELSALIASRDSSEAPKIDYTLSVYLPFWLENHARDKSLKPNTVRGYAVNIQNHIIPVLGNVRLTELKPTDIHAVFEAMGKKGLNGTTRKYVYSVLKLALKDAYRMELVNRNVAEMINPPRKSNYHALFLNDKQLITLFEAVLSEPHGYREALCLMICLGCRRGEALGLKWSDIDFENKTIHICRTATPLKNTYELTDCKTQSSIRYVVMPKALIQVLLEWKTLKGHKEDAFVCIREDGKPVIANTLTKHFKKILHNCGLKNIRLHDLRHSFASLMANKGVPVNTVKEMLGHSDIKTTLSIYTHTVFEDQKKAVSVIDDLF